MDRLAPERNRSKRSDAAGTSAFPQGDRPRINPAEAGARNTGSRTATAVTFLIQRDGELLLQQRTSNAPRYPDAWCFPGGHVEPNESPVACACREIEEEFGLTISPAQCAYLLTYRHDDDEIDDVFHCTIPAGQGLQMNEGRAMEWLRLEEIDGRPLAFEQDRFLPLLGPHLAMLAFEGRSPRIESVHERGSSPTNEDAILVTRTLYGVFDGATSLARHGKPATRAKRAGAVPPTGGLLAASIVRDTFRRDDRPLPDLALEANRAVLAAMVEHGIDPSRKLELWGTTAAVLRIAERTAEWVQIGDSRILVVRRDGSHEFFGRYSDHDASTLTFMKRGALPKAVKREELRVAARANIEYGLINGEPGMVSFLSSGTAALDDIRLIILFTDGLAPPREDPSRPEDWGEFVALYRQTGLSGLRDFVRQTQDSDPDCRIYPRFKPRDDIAAIALDFSIEGCQELSPSDRTSRPRPIQ